MGPGREPLNRLDAALREVHRAFRRAKKPEHLKNRMDFLQASEEARLLGRPRDKLTAEDLCDYVSECAGKLEHPELAYFMPRICEVLASGQSTHPALGWVCALNCLQYADFPNAWPDDQVAAVQGFMEALLAAYVEAPERFPDVTHLGEMLWMAGKGGIDMRAATAALRTSDEQALARALARWIDTDCFLTGDPEQDQPSRWRGSLPDSFAIGQEFTPQVLDWLEAIAPWRSLADAAVRETDPDLRASLRRAAAYCAAWPEAQKPPT